MTKTSGDCKRSAHPKLLLLGPPQPHEPLRSSNIGPITSPKCERPPKRVNNCRCYNNARQSRTSRALFDVNNENQSPVHTIRPMMARNGPVTTKIVCGTGVPIPNRKRIAAAVDKAETSGSRSVSSQQQVVKKTKVSERAFRKIYTLESEQELAIVSVNNDVVEDNVARDRGMSSQDVIEWERVSQQTSGLPTTSAATQTLCLPTVHSTKHPDLNVITPQTVAKVLQGNYETHMTRFQLLDCRFPYEFEGGSLTGASSLCDPKEMETQLFLTSTKDDWTRPVLIFFCEFSANRAPKMLRHVRNVDHSLHVDSYPKLYYPELYLIEGGYKHCFETLRHEICAPFALYVSMADKRFTEMCRREFAIWKRSWKLHKTVAGCIAKVEMSDKISNCGRDRSTVSGIRSLLQELARMEEVEQICITYIALDGMHDISSCLMKRT